MKRVTMRGPACCRLLGAALLAALLPAAPAGVLAHATRAAAPVGLPLGWATFLGGSNDSQASEIVTDRQGNVYVTGYTKSFDFPTTPGAAQPHYGGGDHDAFVASYDASGRLRWATYLGGKGDDTGNAVAADGQGNVYISGSTSSDDFPTTSGAAQPRSGGCTEDGCDAFVASYDASGRLRWATYLGGKGDEGGNGIAADGHGNIYVTGYTYSSDFPVTPGAAHTRHRGDFADAFVASYDAGGRLRWATYLSGGGWDSGNAVAVDGQGNVYVTGATNYLPVTPGAAQTRHTGYDADDAFVASYDANGHVRWATYLGGKGDDWGNSIVTDAQGNAYVTGHTHSRDFPVTSGAAQPLFGNGDHDAFVASYDRGGHVRWATFLGGKGDEEGNGIAVDGQGNLYVTGVTDSPNFPATPGAAQPQYGGGQSNAFVASYDAAGRVRWATFLGGKGSDSGSGIAVGGQDDVYLTGSTNSSRFPITPGGAQTIYDDRANAFVARLVVPAARPAALDPAGPPLAGTPHARFFPQTRHTLVGSFLAAWDKLGGIPTLGLPLSEPFSLGGQQVQVTERAVLVLADGQVHLLPLGTLLSSARIFATVAPVPSTASRLYFPSTGHTLSGPFLAYWQAHQGSTLLGPAISEPDQEGLADGTDRTYTVQWFANGRLELHPEIAEPRYQVEQGRVGFEYLYRLGLLSLAAPAVTSVPRHKLEWIEVPRDQPQIIYEGGTVTDQCNGSGECAEWAMRSQDGGRTWTDLAAAWDLKWNADGPVVSIGALAMTPDGSRVYVPQNSSYEYSPDSSCTVLLTSLDGGRRWSTYSPYRGEDCSDGAGPRTVAISPADPNRVYVEDATSSSAALAVSSDGSKSFPQSNDWPQNGGDALFPDPAARDTIYLYNYNTDTQGSAAAAHLLRSEDAGAHWSAVKAPAGTGSFRPVLDPHEPGLVELRASGLGQPTDRIYLSGDHGRTWRTATCPGALHGACPAFALDNVFGAGHAYAFIGDGIYAFDGAGPARTRLAISDRLPFTVSGLLAVEGGARQGDPVYVFGRAAADQPVQLYRSTDGGQSWQQLS